MKNKHKRSQFMWLKRLKYHSWWEILHQHNKQLISKLNYIKKNNEGKREDEDGIYKIMMGFKPKKTDRFDKQGLGKIREYMHKVIK